MREIRVIELSVDDTARLFHVGAPTVRRRLAGGEWQSTRPVGAGAPLVRLRPADDWIRVEDASALLGVSPATIRANVKRGRLAGRRHDHGRWRVLLRSVLEDPRCDPAAVALFGGEAPEKSQSSTTEISRRPHSLHRSVFVRLTEEEAEMLERCRDRHGTIRGAVVFGLHAIDRDDVDLDAAELRTERDVLAEETGRLRAAHAGLSARARDRMVDELYCQVCEAYVPIGECGTEQLDDGHLVFFHEKHGHRSGGRFRMDTGLAKRAPISLDDAA